MRRPRRWRRSGYRASNLTYESATGSSTRFVRMMAATPIARRNRDFLDHPNLDEQDRHEADDVRGEGGETAE